MAYNTMSAATEENQVDDTQPKVKEELQEEAPSNKQSGNILGIYD